MALDEVGAEKVRAIITREKARDVYDLQYLITKRRIKFEEDLINSKLGYYKIKFSPDSFLKNVSVHQNYYNRELKGLVFGELPGFDEIKDTISDWIKK